MKILSHHLLRESTIVLPKTAQEGQACSSAVEHLPCSQETLGLIQAQEKKYMQERKLVLLLCYGAKEKRNPSLSW